MIFGECTLLATSLLSTGMMVIRGPHTTLYDIALVGISAMSTAQLVLLSWA
ncbi:hypothetical protein [Methylobacterium nigriterrae]|uniref:hypothetical protein n=1 Tax=Methylobacterium nigriterrae TaxID=3127512 RepID=UPI00301416E6